MTSRQNTRVFRPAVVVCLLIISSFITAQVPQNPRPSDDVVRVYTELVQTDVMVFDKEGRFINNLTRDNFQLKVDGKLQPIQAFDLIKAGSSEEAQLMAARGDSNGGPTTPGGPTSPGGPVPLDRGRTVLFFLDDFHTDLGGFHAGRKVMSDFIEKEMGQNDQVAITTATGQVGFLQQLTNNRTVLAQAMQRLKPRSYSVRDSDRPPMSEYNAFLIDSNDIDVFEFFVTETMRQNPGISRDMAAAIVRGRVQQIQGQGSFLTTNLLSSLEKLVRSLSGLPGRKVLFFLSNGFLLNNRRSDATSRLQQITAAAAKSGVVIYSLDVRGLATDPVYDAATPQPFDPSGRLARSSRGEMFALQDGLNALARDTGGKPIFNTNNFRPGVTNAVKETSAYYLLAWRPESDEQKTGRFRKIEVNIVGRSDLVVRVRRGYFDVDPTRPANTKPAEDIATTKTIPKKLRDSIIAPFPQSDLPIILTAVYVDVEAKGPTISASAHIPGQFMTFGPQDGKVQAVVDVTGAFYTTTGEAVTSFLERIVTTAPNAEAAAGFRREITYTRSAVVKPGLYQVRVAALDTKSGRVGSAYGWVEIPDLSKKQLAMSSLLLAERTQAMMANVSNGNEVVPINQSSSRRFRRESNLRFLLFAYNTQLSPTDGKPDVAVQVQVVRDNQPVVTTTLRKINTEGVVDLTHLPYAAEVSLSSLTSGQYLLQVTIIDRLSKQSTSQQTHFEVY
jgi:VWFA-related protein